MRFKNIHNTTEHNHKIKQENIFFEPFQSHILKDYNQTNYTFEKLLIKIYLSRREIKVSWKGWNLVCDNIPFRTFQLRVHSPEIRCLCIMKEPCAIYFKICFYYGIWEPMYLSKDIENFEAFDKFISSNTNFEIWRSEWSLREREELVVAFQNNCHLAEFNLPFCTKGLFG